MGVNKNGFDIIEVGAMAVQLTLFVAYEDYVEYGGSVGWVTDLV